MTTNDLDESAGSPSVDRGSAPDPAKGQVPWIPMNSSSSTGPGAEPAQSSRGLPPPGSPGGARTVDSPTVDRLTPDQGIRRARIQRALRDLQIDEDKLAQLALDPSVGIEARAFLGRLLLKPGVKELVNGMISGGVSLGETFAGPFEPLVMVVGFLVVHFGAPAVEQWLEEGVEPA